MKHRKPFLILMMAVLLLLCGCSGEKTVMNRAGVIREHYSGIPAFTSQVEMTICLRDYEQTFCLQWDADAAQHLVTVLAPEAVAGICARTADGAAELTYGTAVLAIPGTEHTVYPLTALPVYHQQWLTGLYTDTASETLDQRECIAMTYTVQEDVLRMWFDAQTLEPVRSEWYCGGMLEVTCTFLSFSEA